jgi:CBS domain-containing protein
MKIRDIMTWNIECIWPNDTIQDAALAMKERDIALVPVCDRDRIVGMLTDRDITVRAVAEGRDPKSTRVRDVMTPEVICCYEDDDAHKAARLMREQHVGRILVRNRKELLVGIVSLGDLAANTDNPRRIGAVLQEV